jgi:hypothetical protein
MNAAISSSSACTGLSRTTTYRMWLPSKLNAKIVSANAMAIASSTVRRRLKRRTRSSVTFSRSGVGALLSAAFSSAALRAAASRTVDANSGCSRR